jgi:ribosomal protein S18 acetylase RimI-like enzyme
MITIREANARDYEALCDIIDEVDTLHRDQLPHIFQKPAGPVREKEYILGLLADENTGLFVAEVEGQVAGFVHVLICDTPPSPVLVPRHRAFVDSLAVRQELRRHGVGRALMDHAHRWAIAKGAADVELNVFEFNQPAIAFYQALGYETSNRRMVIALHPDCAASRPQGVDRREWKDLPGQGREE